MSKKQLRNRLESLFAELEQVDLAPSEAPAASLAGWTWSCDANGLYTSVSVEAGAAVGIQPADFVGQPLQSFALPEASAAALRSLLDAGRFPAEIELHFLAPGEQEIPVRMSVFSAAGEGDEAYGLRGINQVLAGPLPPARKPRASSSSKPAPEAPHPPAGLTRPPLRSTRQAPQNVWSSAGEGNAARAGEAAPAARISVPIQFVENTSGVLEVVSGNDRKKWSEDDRQLVQEVAAQLELALENAQLYASAQQELSERMRAEQEAQQRALELQTAAEIARDTTSTLALDTLLKRSVNMLRERFNLYHASIFLLEESGFYCVVRESTGEAGEAMKRNQHKLAVGSQSVIGTVTGNGQPYAVNDVSQSQNFKPNPLLPETRSELGIPLKIGARIIGALDVQSVETNVFNADVIAVLQILADQIAVAIDNARSYELAQKAVIEMREIDRVKSQFLANMSHELRTPLNSIIGFSRVILKGIDGPINDTQQQDLGAIYNSGQHLLAMINDILDLSKIEAGKMELASEEINLADLVNSVMSTAIGLIKDKPIQLSRALPEDLPLVQADPMRIRQILLNLISNAAKFTNSGSITVEAGVQTGPEGKREVILKVIDTGAGIAAEDQGKLFQPFSQVDNSPTRKTGGTGLGLSICRSLIELHDGRIGLLNSVVGKGSTFYFTLPLPETPEEPLPEIVDGVTVLAIDDDRQVISLYERYLKPQGYHVIALTTPEQAVERARQLRPFAITLDIMMPNIDGWQVMRALKEDPDTCDIPVIICSILEETEKGFSFGAADYLVKPILQEDLIQALHRLNADGKINDVLVIDDDPEDLRLVQKMIEDTGQYRVTTAQGGARGWEAISNEVPDAIIMDLFMPDVNGFTLLERLRTEPAFRNIPVIVLTGADLSPDQQKQLAEFGQSLLTKGMLREDELLINLETVLKKYKPSGAR